MARQSMDAFVEKSKIFSLLDEQGIDRLAKVAVEVDFPAGAAIVSEGEAGDAFYCVISGTLKVTASDYTNSEKHVATLMSGAVFGEIAALSGEPRTANVTAQSDVRLLKFEMVSVFGVLKDYPQVLAELNRLGITRSEDLLNKFVEE